MSKIQEFEAIPEFSTQQKLLFYQGCKDTVTNPKHLPVFQHWQQHWMELMGKLSKENTC